VLIKRRDGDLTEVQVPCRKNIIDASCALIRSLSSVCGMLLPIPKSRFLRMELILNESAPPVSIIMSNIPSFYIN
jgi:hypothetical protein